jgi:deazaflavin-dependent oxidoreductase (nitroreductase family)
MNPLMNWMNKQAVRRIRNGGSFGRMKVLVLNTVGVKTGRDRSTPVGWFPDGDGRWLVVASAGGGPHNPAWFHNIVGNPDRVTIDVDRRRVSVTPEQLHGAERDRAWASIVAASPRFANYEVKTDREIPVIRLTAT